MLSHVSTAAFFTSTAALVTATFASWRLLEAEELSDLEQPAEPIRIAGPKAAMMKRIGRVVFMGGYDSVAAARTIWGEHRILSDIGVAAVELIIKPAGRFPLYCSGGGMAYTTVLEAVAARRAGSSPVPSTTSTRGEHKTDPDSCQDSWHELTLTPWKRRPA